MRILVDADAFPGAVATILYRAVERCQVPCLFVTNKLLRLPPSPLLTLERVAAGANVADDRIVALVTPGDLVITADIPLASRVVDRGGTALDPRGELYTAVNVKQRLAMRDLLDSLRSEGSIGGGPAGFSERHVQAFANQLDRHLARQARPPRPPPAG